MPPAKLTADAPHPLPSEGGSYVYENGELIRVDFTAPAAAPGEEPDDPAPDTDPEKEA